MAIDDRPRADLRPPTEEPAAEAEPMKPAGVREMMRLRSKIRREATEEAYVDEDTREAGSVVTAMRNGFGTVVVYKLTPSGCTRIAVQVQGLDRVLSHPNYALECFDCGSDECLYDTSVRGEMPTNKCPGKPSRMYRRCPVPSCSKHIGDPKPTGKFARDEFDHMERADDDDQNMIVDEAFETSTPASRTKAMMDLHLIATHPQTAQELGIAMPRDLPQLAVVS